MTLRKLALLAVVIMAAAACSNGQSSTATAKQGGTLRIVIGAEPTGTMDTLYLLNDQAINAGYEVIEGLTSVYDSDGTIQPGLASSWTASPDARTWTFTLRKGVRFQDGTDFNAQAVKANVDRWLNPSLTFTDYAQLRNIAQSTVVDDTHIKFELKNALSYFPGTLATYEAGIESPASWNQAPNTLAHADNIVGTGPYTFKEYVKTVHVLLERNANYWGPKAAFKELEFKIITDAATREAQIRANTADYIFQPPPSDLQSLTADPSLKALIGPSRRSVFIGIDTQDRQQPLLKDPRVRQALNYAVDRQSIVKNVLFGLADPAVSPVPPTMANCSVTPKYTYDPQKAKDLLAQAGATGMSIRLLSPTGRLIQDFQAATAIAGNLRDIGLKVDGPQTKDYASLTAIYNVPPSREDWDLFLAGISPSYPAVGAQMVYFDGRKVVPAGNNQSYYSNPSVDALITQGDQNPDQAAALKSYCMAAQTVWTEAPWIFLWVQKGFSVYNAKIVKGMRLMPNEMVNFNYAQPA
jgi:peptide/nickel transport system substrate-binding protein